MAILKGLIRKMSGSAGDFTFSQNQGRTIVSEKITATTNRKTSGQQRTRTKWSNIIHNYQGILPLLDCAFESKVQGVSDYNMFVKINMQRQAVYLTRSEVNGGACVAAPYAITQGSLPAIVVTTSGNQDVTDIAVGSLTVNAQTTVAAFANAVVQNNVDYDYGDQISFYLVEQYINAATSMPYCTFNAYRVVLDKTDTALLLGQVPADAFMVVNGHIGHATVSGNVAYAWVHSRKNAGKTKVSSQSLVCHNALLANYTGDSAYQMAALSYGGERKVFLTPGSVEITTAGDSNGGSGSGSGSGNQTGGGSGSGSNTGGGSGSGTGSGDNTGGGSESGSGDEGNGEGDI